MADTVRVWHRVPLLGQSLRVKPNPVAVLVRLDVVNVHRGHVDHVRRRVLDDFVQRGHVVLFRHRVRIVHPLAVLVVGPQHGRTVADRVVQQVGTFVWFVALWKWRKLRFLATSLVSVIRILPGRNPPGN